MRVCKEWGSLLLNEDVKVVCEDQKATDWIGEFFSSTNFMAQAQATAVRAFGLGTGAWALRVDLDRKKVRIRRYGARMVIPLTWDEDGIVECAFVTRAFYRGKAIDQLQMHLKGGMIFSAELPPSSPSAPSPSESSTGFSHGLIGMDGEGVYRIVTVFFDKDGNELSPMGIAAEYDTGCPFPTFGIVKPAVTNTRVDMSPYGQSVFADEVNAVQAVDLTFDAPINEVDLSNMRVFLSDVLFDRETDGNKNVTIPFGKQDCTVFRKVMSMEGTIQEFAPALRTSSQIDAFRIALQALGDLTGFGLSYFDLDDSRTFVKTATEVSSDNSALTRNIRRHENALEGAIADIARAVMCVSLGFGESIPAEGSVRVQHDDSIVQDTAAEKGRDMAEVGVTMHAWKYRQKWYGEEKKVAKARARGLGKKSPQVDSCES